MLHSFAGRSALVFGGIFQRRRANICDKAGLRFEDKTIRSRWKKPVLERLPSRTLFEEFVKAARSNTRTDLAARRIGLSFKLSFRASHDLLGTCEPRSTVSAF